MSSCALLFGQHAYINNKNVLNKNNNKQDKIGKLIKYKGRAHKFLYEMFEDLIK